MRDYRVLSPKFDIYLTHPSKAQRSSYKRRKGAEAVNKYREIVSSTYSRAVICKNSLWL